MLDAAFIRDNLEAVKANCKNRLAAHAEVDRVVELDDLRKKLVSETQALQERANQISKLIGPEKDAAKKEELKAEGKALRERKTVMEAEVKKVEADLHAALLTIPNMTHPDAPIGATPADNKVISKWGEPRRFDFAPKDHVALAEALDLVDFEAGAAVTGNKFYFLKNEGALLELALVQYAMQTLIAEGFTPIITPDLARIDILEGIGFQPRDNAATRQVYTIADSDLCLIATAEITLGGMHKDEIFDEAKLPLKYVGLSHCFRTEAGAAGRDTKGLYRVHQFTKVEMFGFCTPEQSEALHLEILAIEEEIFQGLGLAYQVLDTCTADLGGPAYRKYDLEAWMPCRGTSTRRPVGQRGVRRGDEHVELHRFSGQKAEHQVQGAARRDAVRPHAEQDGGCGDAGDRGDLENYQRADGTIEVPGCCGLDRAR